MLEAAAAEHALHSSAVGGSANLSVQTVTDAAQPAEVLPASFVVVVPRAEPCRLHRRLYR